MILGNGGEKVTRTYEENEKLSGYVLDLQKFDFLLKEARKNGKAKNITDALDFVYSSPVYSKLEIEKTKYWWFGTNSLYEEMIED